MSRSVAGAGFMVDPDAELRATIQTLAELEGELAEVDKLLTALRERFDGLPVFELRVLRAKLRARLKTDPDATPVDGLALKLAGSKRPP